MKSGAKPGDPTQLVENMLFICSRCKKLCVAPAITWSCIDDPQILAKKKQLTSKTQKNITVQLNDQAKWSNASCYQDFISFFSKHDINVFPLCNSCSGLQCEAIARQKEFFFIESINLSKQIIPQNYQICNMMRQKIKKTKEETSVLREICNEKMKETHEARPPPSINQEEKVIRYVYQEVESKVLRGEHIKYGSILKATMYHIGFYRFYGTINGSRFGNYCPEHVPQEELETSIFLFTNLLLEIAKPLGIDTSRISIGSSLVFKLGHPYSLNCSDMKSKKTLKLFNEAIFILICISNQILQSFYGGQPHPPFRIDINNKTIAGFSFEYSRKHASEWTRSMKALLTDIKSVQVQMMSKGVMDL